MSETKTGGASGAETPAPTTGKKAKGFELVDIDPKSTVFVSLTNREYNLAELTDSDAQQLLDRGWPHIKAK